MTTGPNTEEGKATVAANGIRHGLRSEKMVLPEVESIEEWEDFRTGFIDSLKPIGRLEEELAERVAQLAWRLRRGSRAEHDAVAREHAIANDPGTIVRRLYRDALLDRLDPVPARVLQLHAEATGEETPTLPPPPPSTLPPEKALNTIMRYEQQYTRQLFQTLHALQALQDRHNGKAAPLVRIQWH